MRKPFLVAGVATLALGVSGPAYAQNPAPELDVNVKVSPTKAGTKKKPKNTKLSLEVKNSEESKATASRITVTLPSTLKLNTRGLPTCRASENDLIANVNVCRSSIAGKGKAHALVNPFAPNRTELEFKITALVGSKQLLFVLDSDIADAVLYGKIKGRKMTINIPDFLQQPAPGTYSALLDLSVNLSKKKGKRSLFTSTGCKSKAHKIGVKVDFVPNPNPPAASSASATGEARCR